jgi:pimeloyl-ACP methyl ester carboxylesterase
MSAITVGGDIVHYEVLGRGKPVVLVHGWVGSWRYWIPTMQQLHLKYRVYALDLFGFGDSAKNPDRYTLDHQLALMTEFMQQLGLGKAVLIGHGLGAQVSAEFAVRNKEMVHRLMLTSAPLYEVSDLWSRNQRTLLNTRDFDPKKAIAIEVENVAKTSSPATSSHTDVTIARRPDLTPPPTPLQAAEVTIPSRAKLEAEALRLAEAAINARKTGEQTQVTPPLANDVAASPKTGTVENPLYERINRQESAESLLARCFRKTETEYTKLSQDVAKQDSIAIQKMAAEFDAGKMIDAVKSLTMPTVIVHGMEDPIVTAPSENVWAFLTLNREDQIVPILLPGVRHFPMLESESFIRMLGGFLDTPDLSKLEVKERWRRRSR